MFKRKLVDAVLNKMMPMLALVLLVSCGGGGGGGGAGGAAPSASPTTSATPTAIPTATPTPAVASSKLNDTGITSGGYDTSGNYVASCASAAAGNDCNTGRDATANDDSDGKAGFSFTKIAADGSELPASATSWSCVKDNFTGLIWEVKTTSGLHDWHKTFTNYDSTAAGQTGLGDGKPTQAQIDSIANSVGFKNAVNTAGLCGASDWRLPTVLELMSIVDYGVAPGSAIDANWFPNTFADYYWSSSPNMGPGHAWYVHFGAGVVSTYTRYNVMDVRLVRGGSAVVSNRYQVSADGQEVTDTTTNLIWRRCAEGMSWDGTTCTGSAVTYTHANALQRAQSEANASGKAWRLPNVKELVSIVDQSRYCPAIDNIAFPATPSTYAGSDTHFWSSSPYVGNSSNAWQVHFCTGEANGPNSARTNSYAVRLVRVGP